MKCLNNKKFLGSVLLGAFVITGLYNAVVMNSESNLSSDMKLVKRLDEMYGVTTQGRKIASNTSWSKIQPLAVKTGSFKVAPTNLVENKAIVTEVSEAAIQEELTLNLIEVVNAQKWQQGLATGQFNGSLTANNGVIETLSVSLPEGQGLSINFTELNGNVFNYEMAGQEFSGMLYQVDQNSYMVSLTNGPLGGTRLRFGGEATTEIKEDIQRSLAENNIEAGNFGSEQAPVTEDRAPKAEVQTAGFNFSEII